MRKIAQTSMMYTRIRETHTRFVLPILFAQPREELRRHPVIPASRHVRNLLLREQPRRLAIMAITIAAQKRSDASFT